MLTEHTHAAEIDGGLVFLDLKADAYTYLDREKSSRLLQLMSGERAADCSGLGAGHGADAADDRFLRELVAAGLVTAASPGKAFRPIRHEAVVAELPRLIGPDCPRAGAGHVFNFVWAVTASRILLRTVTLDRALHFVRKQRSKARRSAGKGSREEVTEIYRRLRPLLLTKKDQCLLDAISLVLFLSRYGIEASVRFGVRLEPFRAHAWVQDRDAVFDDMAALIHDFTVILEV